METIDVIFYRDERSVPALEWLQKLPEGAYAKGRARIERLAEMGYELRRPEADYLGNDIYELR